jgi:hypothetical protein
VQGPEALWEMFSRKEQGPPAPRTPLLLCDKDRPPPSLHRAELLGAEEDLFCGGISSS